MKIKNFKKITQTFVLCAAFLPLISASAADFRFDPQEKTVGTKQDFVVALLLDADKPVNALDVSLAIPSSLTPISTSDGNSIVNYWIVKPTYDPLTHRLKLSGIIPGGYSGVGGRIVEMTFRANTLGKTLLDVDKIASKVLLNDGKGSEDTLTSHTLALVVDAGRENLSNVIPDTTPPEEFKPLLVHDPLIYNGDAALVFATQDKDSGVNSYEVEETAGSVPDDTKWVKADSPFRLKDQALHSYIFVKAIDNADNVRIETIIPVHPQNTSMWQWLLLAILCIAVFIGLMRKGILKK